jgi:hypothetical protein
MVKLQDRVLKVVTMETTAFWDVMAMYFWQIGTIVSEECTASTSG